MNEIKCPKHTTGGGPCYCGYTIGIDPAKSSGWSHVEIEYHRPLRQYTIGTASGDQIITVAASMSEAIKQTGVTDVTSAKSEPWTPIKELRQLANSIEGSCDD